MDEPAAFDGPWKEALEWFFEPFLAFFFPTVHAGIDWLRGFEFLDKELQKIVPEAEVGQGTVDKLVKVWARDGEETRVYVHVEVQSQHDASFSRRMYVYNHRLSDRYGRMPVSLAILGDNGPAWRPGAFQMGRWGCEVRFTFPAVKLLDYRARERDLERDSSPFAAITLAHLKTIETHDSAPDRAGWKLRLVKGLYDRGLNREQMVLLFRLIDWMMALPRETQRTFIRDIEAFEKERAMPIVTPTEKMWLEDGRQQGLLAGIEAALDVRFGAEGLALMPRVRRLTDLAALEGLLNQIRRESDIAAVEKLLPSVESGESRER